MDTDTLYIINRYPARWTLVSPLCLFYLLMTPMMLLTLLILVCTVNCLPNTSPPLTSLQSYSFSENLGSKLSIYWSITKNGTDDVLDMAMLLNSPIKRYKLNQ